MSNNIEVRPSDKGRDYRHLLINGVDMGTWERSQLRQLIEKIDNNI